MGGSAPRVLAVDDEENVCQLVSRLLSRAGWDTDSAQDGETALAKIAACRPDLVLLDVKMPGLGGLELLGRLREQPEPPAVVAMTGLTDFATFAALVRGGAAAYVAKPFEGRELVDLCDRVLRSLRRHAAGTDERRREPAVDGEELTLEHNAPRHLLEGADGELEPLVEQPPPALELRPEERELAFHPTRGNSGDDSAAREQVEGRQLLERDERVALRDDERRDPELEALRTRRQEAQ